MNIKSKIIYSFLAIAGLLASCSKDFLDRPPLSEISTENFYQTTNDLRLATAALYAGSQWADWTYSSYLEVGEVLSGNMNLGYNGDAAQFNTFSVTGLNGALASNWKGMYNVIIHSNITINTITEKAPASIPETDKNAAIAEARFMRAYAYYNLAMLWQDVPIITDNIKLINSPLVYRNNVQDVFQFAINDLTYAAYHLPLTDSKGRLTAWSAMGMLSKVYLTYAGVKSQGSGQRDQALLDSARLYSGFVCQASGLELLDNYANLFKTQYNDNPESLFALQWDPSVGDWLKGNMLQIYSPGGTDIAADGQAGWFGIYPTYDMYKQYSVKDTVRRKATFMFKNAYYPELNAAGGGYTYKGDAGLKKHIIGTKKDNNASIMTLTSSAEHNSLLRLADVYLIYAEAILGNNTTTSNAEALLYFNKVRTRAGLDPVTTIQADSLMKERRIELAAEAEYWFDLIRLSFYNPQKSVDMLNNQERVSIKYENGVVIPSGTFVTATPATITTFKFPIPSSELTADPLLAEPPVPYTFQNSK
jgi:starch-binding outer membrane protein, SusD/RagB family